MRRCFFLFERITARMYFTPYVVQKFIETVLAFILDVLGTATLGAKFACKLVFVHRWHSLLDGLDALAHGNAVASS